MQDPFPGRAHPVCYPCVQTKGRKVRWLTRSPNSAGGRLRFRFPERWFLLGLGVTCAIAAADFLTGSEVILIGLLVTGPLLTSVRSSPRKTAIVGAVAVLLALVEGYGDDILGTRDFWIRSGGVFLVSALAVWAAGVREGVESAVAEQQERLRAIVENSADGLFLIDRKAVIRYASLSTERLLGYSASEQIGRRIDDVVDREDAARVRDLVSRCIATPGLPVEIAFRFRRKDGVWIDIAGTAVNRLDEPANASIVVNFRDIGDRLRAEEALRATQQFNQAIIEGAGEGIVVYDRELRYVVWNPAMEKLTGLPESEVLGRSAGELFPHLRASGSLALIERALAGEHTNSHDIDFRIEQTGRWGWVSASYSPHRDAGGEIVGVIGMVRDVTERVQAEETIRTRERQLAEAQRVAQLGSWEWDVPADTVFWSDELCRICGIRPSAAPANLEAVLHLVHPEDRVMVEREITTAIRDLRPIAFDARFLRPSGSPRILQARGRVVSDEAGNALRLVATGHDITESRTAEEALKIRDRAIAAIPEALLITDNTQPDNPIVYVNSAFEKLTGYRFADVVGKNCRFLQGPGTDEIAVGVLREAVDHGRAVRGVRLLNYRKDGTSFWNSVSIEPIANESGHVTHFVGLLGEAERPDAEPAADPRAITGGFAPSRR